MLDTVNLKKSLSKSAYQKAMPELQERLRKLQYEAKEAKVTTILCLEGWDASGKGNIVRKLTEKLDPRVFRVYPGSPPTPLEQRYHFLHRYQMALPNYGDMAVFDHGWYRRVLDERCDKLVKKSEWRDAYQQINEFERWLSDDGQVIVKFWLHISKKKQKQRFKKYLADPNLRWRVTKEYRQHHADYNKWIPAIEDMLAKTETSYAPWTVVEANDQRWAVVRVFEVLAQQMEKELARRKQDKSPSASAAEAPRIGVKKKTSARKRTAHVNGHSDSRPAQAEAAHA